MDNHWTQQKKQKLSSTLSFGGRRVQNTGIFLRKTIVVAIFRSIKILSTWFSEKISLQLKFQSSSMYLATELEIETFLNRISNDLFPNFQITKFWVWSLWKFKFQFSCKYISVIQIFIESNKNIFFVQQCVV
jgi:hypothetical protein